jgi:hypothetical protein
MNKGVELLRARRETNPEEFVISLEDGGKDSRWFNLLAEHDVDLDDPDAKILRPRVFAREVMDRLLTARDLEPKSSAISREQLLKELLPGLNALFGMEYAKYSEEIKDKFNER